MRAAHAVAQGQRLRVAKGPEVAKCEAPMKMRKSDA